MAKKIFVTKARLVQGKRWYIDYSRFDPVTGEISRHRQDFSLNDIADLSIRAHVGNILVQHLEQFVSVQNTQPTVQNVQSTVQSKDTVKQSVTEAIQEKMSGPRKNTGKSYKSIGGSFLEWAERLRYADIPLDEFGIKHAQAFFSYIKARKKYKGRTLNNYIITMRAVWNWLVDQERVKSNPFQKVKMFREEEKERRTFTVDERRTVAAYIEQNDYWLFRALLLQYFCYIRPIEISRLKFRAFDFTTGTVKVEAFEAKKWKERTPTIPRSILHYFTDGIFNAQPTNYYILGSVENRKIGPAPKPASENRQYKRHRKYLLLLKDRGELKDISGLTWYSWKDTGISRHVKETTALATRDQAGHQSIDMTLTYYHQDTVNDEYQKITNDLI